MEMASPRILLELRLAGSIKTVAESLPADVSITRIERFEANEDVENSAERPVNTSESFVQGNWGCITRWVSSEGNGSHH
jgi:hypothetical protein